MRHLVCDQLFIFFIKEVVCCVKCDMPATHTIRHAAVTHLSLLPLCKEDKWNGTYLLLKTATRINWELEEPSCLTSWYSCPRASTQGVRLLHRQRDGSVLPRPTSAKLSRVCFLCTEDLTANQLFVYLEFSGSNFGWVWTKQSECLVRITSHCTGNWHS